MSDNTTSSSTFESTFFKDQTAIQIKVPDYQRAYSWELEQIDLFIADLEQYIDSKSYYFGHFIVESHKPQTDDEILEPWEVVDGQQRLTTFVLFLMTCQHLTNYEPAAYSLIDRFTTVSYDIDGLATIAMNLSGYLGSNKAFNPKKPPEDAELMAGFGISEKFTHSQRRMALALLRFHYAFEKGDLDKEKIPAYIEVVMQAHCSCHVTEDKAVAVNIFEMHNTRGVPLSTLEILKAKLMQFVYSKGDSKSDENGRSERDRKVTEIQKEFGEIYAMEEGLAKSSFRGEITMDNLLRQHLRVIDDGTKRTAEAFHNPAANANSEELIKYIDEKLLRADLDYALDLACELKSSVRIMVETLPVWDREDRLVGDVMILERELSCEWFLLICRRLSTNNGKINGRVSVPTLACWERLLFTRNFHNEYYNLKGSRDNFPKLFEQVGANESEVSAVLKKYLSTGFRSDRTNGLQNIVRNFITDNKSKVLNMAFHWHPWRSKMTYALYKYEADLNSDIRNVMKETVSVEHILPQEWQWEWVNLREEDREPFLQKINACINGIGNLLLLTRGENSSVGNTHPAEKRYRRYELEGSYKWHHESRDAWENAAKWEILISERGKEIFDFILLTLVDAQKN